MNPQLISPTGGHPDVCFHNNQLHYVYQDRELLYVCTPAGTTPILLGSDVLAFPRVLSALGHFYVLYREGASRGGHAVLLCDGVKTFETPFECGGNNPVSFGYHQGEWVIACVERYSQNVHRFTIPALTHTILTTVPGTGIAYLAVNRVVTWDENYGSRLPDMTAPTYAGLLVAGEHPVNGALVQHITTGKEHLFFPGQFANTPRIAMNATGSLYALVTWGPPGVRLETFDLNELQMPVTPYPPGKGWTERTDVTSISLTNYLFPNYNFTRNRAHYPQDNITDYTHLFQAQQTATGVQHTKELGNIVRSALWTVSLDGKYWGLAWDATDQKNGYQVVLPGTTITAPLYPSVMKVGRAHMRTVNVDILTPDGRRTNVRWRGYVEKIYNGPAVGSVLAGAHWANIIWDFDDPNGFREENFCVEGLGPFMWHETRKSNGSVRRWAGVYDVPPIPDPLIDAKYYNNRPPSEGTMPTAPPGVQIDTYNPRPQNGVDSTLLHLTNRTDPTEMVIVTVRGGSLFVEWKNAAGSNKSALKRPITFGP